MSGVNRVIILGRLGSDPEVKNLPNGQIMARFNVATNDQWLDRNGQRQERTEWHRVVVWNKLADVCGKYLSKGRRAYVEGRIQTSSWEDQQGQKRYTTEVIATVVRFIDSSRDQQPMSSNNMGYGSMGPSSHMESNIGMGSSSNSMESNSNMGGSSSMGSSNMESNMGMGSSSMGSSSNSMESNSNMGGSSSMGSSNMESNMGMGSSSMGSSSNSMESNSNMERSSSMGSSNASTSTDDDFGPPPSFNKEEENTF